MVRRVTALMLAIAACGGSAYGDPADGPGPGAARVAAFVEALRADAQRSGITPATFAAALANFTPDPRIIAATRKEPEYGRPVGAYVDSLVSASHVAAGAAQAARQASLLDAIEKKYGVERWIILALWGVESSFGSARDRWDVIRSLATLAEARYRDPYFRNELLVALRILQERHIGRDRMLGSWAGAMGQPQFMPSSFYDYAVDFSGDGRRDIWTNVPDVLASIGNYMARSGEGFLLFPSGASGPAFLATSNFVVIKRYNNSDTYALAVGHLADRMHGGGPFRAAWPNPDPQLSRDARIALQRKMAALGYKIGDFAGRLDFDQRDAIRDIQMKFGMTPDGHPTPALLERLGVASQ